MGGHPCQPWARQWPHAHSSFLPGQFKTANGTFLQDNYCRNPSSRNPSGADSKAPWCYTTAHASPVWEYCAGVCHAKLGASPVPPLPQR